MAERKIATWTNRRRIAWLSFMMLCILMLGMTYRLMFGGDDPAGWTGLGSMLIGVFGGIVIAYTGFKAMKPDTGAGK